jgi:DNA replication protein DnaC
MDLTDIFKHDDPAESRNANTEEVKRGTEIYRTAAKRGAGLLKRHISADLSGFAPRAGQEKAFSLCKSYAETWTKATEKGLLLNGGVGCGKTHLAAAICNYIIDRIVINEDDARWYASQSLPRATVDTGIMFTSSVALLSDVKSTFGTAVAPENVMNKYRYADLLVIDDLATEKTTEWASEQLYDIIDFRYNEYLPMIVTTNLTVAELKVAIGSRITDRLRCMCKLATISAPSQRETA